jgi:hypothetical protein
MGMHIVDGLTLSAAHRALLRPGENINDGRDDRHMLPRYFFQIESWEQARQTYLTAHFTVAELMSVDCREADLLLNTFPHYVPCAVALLARYLEEFRRHVESPVSVSVNGGYRSPSHRLTSSANPHLWGTAADIYRVGDTWLDHPKAIEKYGRVAQNIGQELTVLPFGHGPEQTDDHLHFDLGYTHFVPRRSGEPAIGSH